MGKFYMDPPTGISLLKKKKKSPLGQIGKNLCPGGHQCPESPETVRKNLCWYILLLLIRLFPEGVQFPVAA